MSVGQWLSVGFGAGAWSTLRRKPQSMRRISTASAERGAQTRGESRSASVVSWSWYSNSEADLMLMSRNRANSFELLAPHPSTMLKAIDSAALVIWDLSEPRSLRGNRRIARRTPSTSPCALCHTKSRRKSCTAGFCTDLHQSQRRFLTIAFKSFPDPPLKTIDNWRTDKLTTQNLHPFRPKTDSARHEAGTLQ